MPTVAEEAFAESFADLLSVHGKTWTFGAATFPGAFSAIKSDDPRMEGSADQLFEVIASTASLPSPGPKRGDEISVGGETYRLTRKPAGNPATGLTTFVVVEA